MTYSELLESKCQRPRDGGFLPDPLHIPREAFPFQRHVIDLAVRCGRYAIFADCGLGKTLMQLAWAVQVMIRTGRPVLVLCPLAVAKQTLEEAGKFGINAHIIEDASGVRSDSINLMNYEKLHKVDASVFAGIVLDESSILKSFTGATKRALCDSFAETPYKLCCTATPAPNDYVELGNHAQFLGVMESSEMLSRWFINDSMKAGGYRLKGHAEKDFNRWICSWSSWLDKPSDVGFSDEGYELPPLRMEYHTVTVDHLHGAQPGELFRVADHLDV